MKEMDCVEVIVENDSYAKEGVHQGMQGWICDSRCINGRWLVMIPQYGEKENIAALPIKEENLVLLHGGMDARINERIKEEYGG